jgi:phytoene dehydrogenase-like protein
VADVDVIVIGGGHNGLTCAGYLARAGLSVAVLERREIVGGCATTEELVPSQPGFRFNGGATELLGFTGQPVYRDLELARHGLELIESDPMFMMPFPHGKHIFVHRSFEQTVESIARVSPEDAAAYRRYQALWGGLDELLGPTYTRPGVLPGRRPLPAGAAARTRPPLRTAIRDARDQALRTARSLGPARRFLRSTDVAEMTRIALMPARRYIEEAFHAPEMRSLMAFFAMQTKTSLDEPGSALGMVELPWSHAGGVTRPRGGMSAVCEAIARAVSHHGGEIVLGRHVEEILVRAGRAVGVRTRDGETYSARRGVVAAISPVRVFSRLIAPDQLDPAFRRRVESIQVDNTGVIKVFYALSAAPVFSNSGDDGSDRSFRTAAGMLCPSIEHADAMWAAVRRRELPESIGWSWCTHTSTLDPSMAPNGGHTLGLHVWVPVELAEGRRWDHEARATMAARLLDEYARCAPNVKGAVIDWAARAPADYEAATDNPNGNMFHVDFVPHQMFGLRPLPELSDYRTPLAGLYLTGAGTHPGPAVTGLPGHNTAHAVLSDLREI